MTTLPAIEHHATSLLQLATSSSLFNDAQSDVVVHSLVHALISTRDPVTIKLLLSLEASTLPHIKQMKWMHLKFFVQSRGHLPYKVSTTLKESVKLFRKVVGQPGEPLFDALFRRALSGGRWQQALLHATPLSSSTTTWTTATDPRPWVVLVMGCNGIRKTTSVYQTWFKKALAFSLGNTFTGDVNALPDGNNSYFRQLDYMMATMGHDEFTKVYQSDCCSPATASSASSSSTSSTSSSSASSSTTTSAAPSFSKEQVQTYMNVKGGIFARYRSLCETLGGLLIESAISKNMNVMVETSGKDIASFHYINNFFNDEQYRKLVVNFTVSDLKHAKHSVNHRMSNEMLQGHALVNKMETSVDELISVNCGGPYGGDQLAAVAEASKKTWEQVTKESTIENPWSNWYKAHIDIDGGEKEGSEGWTACAVGVGDGGTDRKSEVYRTFDRAGIGQSGGGMVVQRPQKRAKKK